MSRQPRKSAPSGAHAITAAKQSTNENLTAPPRFDRSPEFWSAQCPRFENPGDDLSVVVAHLNWIGLEFVRHDELLELVCDFLVRTHGEDLVQVTLRELAT